jgi:endoglucanase
MRPASHEFLQKLLNTPSPSSAETRGQRVWLDYAKAFADEVRTDAYGNGIAVLNPDAHPRLMVGGHADELAFLINYIDDEGFAYFTPAGGQDPGLARGQRVVVHTEKGPVAGVIGSLAIHLQDRGKDNGKIPEWHELFIDIGVASRKEAEARIRVGDLVTYAAGYQQLSEDVFTARGCDNRIGTFVAAETLRLCFEQKRKLKACLVAVSTIQEENGLYGASMVGQSVHPDVALMVDVGHATDIPLVSKKQWGDVKLGRGPILSSGSVNHPVVVDRLAKVAGRQKITIQRGIDARRSGTDADAVFVLHGGIPSAAIGVPNRYMHSPVECISLKDLETTAQWMSSFALDLKAGETFKVQV